MSTLTCASEYFTMRSVMEMRFEEMIGGGEMQVPGLGVIVYKGGREVFSKFLGDRIVGSKPITRETRFRAASVSKMFTAFGIMQLVERNAIDLDEEADRYLQFRLRNPNQARKKITVRMLLDHTSSIRDGEDFFAPIDQKIGEYFCYCNLNYCLLGTIIENVTGERFDLYQKRNILQPLDMRADYVPANLDREAFEMLGTLYRRSPRGEWFGTTDDYRGVQPSSDLSDYEIGSDATIFAPQGGLRISFEEMTHALEMLMNGGEFRGRRILSRESIEEMLKPQWIFDPKLGNGDTYDGVMLSYGLGVYQIDGRSSARMCRDREIDLIGHTGVAHGMFSGIFFRPNSGDGFVYMMNGSPLDEEIDPRARGEFSGNYIFEERVTDALCRML